MRTAARTRTVAVALLLLMFALLAGCGGKGGPPADANEWSCADWKNAGLGGDNGLSETGALALTSLGNDVDALRNYYGSVRDKKDAVAFYVAQICARNPNARPGALAVSKARAAQDKAQRKAEDANPKPLDQSGSGSTSPPSGGGTSSGGSSGGGSSTTPNSGSDSPDSGNSGSGEQHTQTIDPNATPPVGGTGEQPQSNCCGHSESETP